MAPGIKTDTPKTRQSTNPWAVLALICLPVFIGALDLTIVSAFLPEIIVGFELPLQSVVQDAAWVVSGYLLAYTVSMIFMGRVSDLIGRRRTYIAALVIFTLGSVIVAEVDPQARGGVAGLLYNALFRLQGARPDPGNVALMTVIIGRVVQALGAGALVPVSLALVADLFPPEKRGQPLGVIGAVDTLGWVLGHLYGGILVNFFSANQQGFIDLFRQLNLDLPPPDWRTLFWINVPITLMVLIITWRVLRGAPQKRAKGRFDIFGTLLIVGALIGLVVGLGANVEVASTTTSFEDLGGLPPYALPVLTASMLMFVGFILVESRVRDPLFELHVFRRRNYAAGLLTNLFVGFCLMIGLVSVPILVNVRVADPSKLAEAALQVGVLLSALTVPMALAAVPGGWLSERVGYRIVAGGGLLLALVGFALIGLTWTLEIPDSTVALHMAMVGVGLGLTFSPISSAVINAADKDHLGVASALVIIMRLIGMTLSVSILTTLSSERLAFLVSQELGAGGALATTDVYAQIDTYARLTVRVLAEIGLLGALVCAAGLIPALLLRGRGMTAAEKRTTGEMPVTTGD